MFRVSQKEKTDIALTLETFSSNMLYNNIIIFVIHFVLMMLISYYNLSLNKYHKAELLTTG